MTSSSTSASVAEETIGAGRDFWLFAVGQAVSVAGDRIALIALVFLVVRLSHSYAPALALFYIVRAVPTLAAGLMAGVVVDHFQRQRIMVRADIGRGILLAVAPTLAHFSLWALYPVVLVLYGVTMLFNTAARAALPDVVPASRLITGNAILNTIESSADLFYIVGGVLVAFLTQDMPFYIDAASFLFSALMVSAMRIPYNEQGALPDMRAIRQRIGEGVRYILANPYLKWSTLAFAIGPFAGGGVVVLTPLYAAHTLGHTAHLVGPLHSGVFRFSVLEVTLGIGALLGGAVALPLRRWMKRGALVGLGFTGVGLSYAALAFTNNLYVAASITASVGLFNSLFIVVGMTLTQSLTPSEIRGRVVAARVTVAQSALALGSAFGGAALVSLSYAHLWLILGGMIVLASLSVWLVEDVRGQD